MEKYLFIKFIGMLVFLSGIVLAVNPELLSNKPVPEDIYEAVERRIWWGLVIGFGLLAMFHHQLKPWLFTLSATGIALVTGFLIARFIGIALDGTVLRQWFWVGAELLILLILLIWYGKVKPDASTNPDT